MPLGQGLAQGLSVNIDYNQRTQNLFRNEQLEQVQRNVERQRNYILAKDLEYGEANNQWDGPLLKNFAEKKTNEIGKFIYENPDYDRDPQKYAKYNSMVKELKQNPYTQRASRFAQEMNRYIEFINDPKNGEFTDDPLIHHARQKIDNYLNTGSVDGVMANQREFRFIPPTEQVNTAGLIQEAFSSINRRGTAPYGSGVDGLRQYATDEDQLAVAYNIWNDQSTDGRAIRSEWAKLPEEVRSKFKDNPLQWVKSRGAGFLPEDKFTQSRNAPGGGSGSSASGSGSANPWETQVLAPLFTALSNGVSNPIVNTNPATMSGIITAPDGSINIRNEGPTTNDYAVAVTADGKRHVLPALGTFYNSMETGRVRAVESTDTAGNANGVKRMEAEVATEISINQLLEIEDDAFPDAIDLDNQWEAIKNIGSKLLGGGAGVDEMNDFEIRKQYRNIFTKTGKVHEDGSQIVRMNIWMPMGTSANIIYNNKMVNKLKQEAPQYAEGGLIESNVPDTLSDGEIVDLGGNRKAVLKNGVWTPYIGEE